MTAIVVQKGADRRGGAADRKEGVPTRKEVPPCAWLCFISRDDGSGWFFLL